MDYGQSMPSPPVSVPVSLPGTGYAAPNLVSIPATSGSETTSIGLGSILPGALGLLLPKLLFVIPLFVAVVVVVVVVVTRFIIIPVLFFLFPKFKKNLGDFTQCEEPAKIPVYYPPEEYGYDDGKGAETKIRKRREASGFPLLDLDKINRLSNIVLVALKAQECQDKLLCELGKLSRSTPFHNFFNIFESSMPRSFVNGTDCEKYLCKTAAMWQGKDIRYTI